MIERVAYEEIDKKAYDSCVSGSENFRVCATSRYLDAVARDWDTLVFKDYRAVMPLPRRRKFGLTYVYTPAFVQQLGIFSREEVRADLENEFHKKLVSKYILADYAFHSGSRKRAGWEERVNYTLNLNRDYEDFAIQDRKKLT